jgi:plasmid maintenance system antidote protein VapI
MRLGVSMDTLMRMQNSFDIAEARKREGEIKSPAARASRPMSPVARPTRQQEMPHAQAGQSVLLPHLDSNK